MLTYREFVSKHLKNKKFATKHDRGMAMKEVARMWHIYKKDGKSGTGKKKGKKGRGPIGALIGSLVPKLFSDNDLYSAVGGVAGSFLPI
jgi:hypothetical protein